ncbi:MAG: nitrilase-related carbon-nitrogen hydrolase, partial [Pseudonocardiaceae bacterium]
LHQNLGTILEGVERATEAGARLLVTPEMSLTGWSLPEASVRTAMAELVATEAIPALAEATDRSGVAVVVGGPHPEDGPAQANAAIAVAPGGNRAVYRKVHLYGPERDWWKPGDQACAILEVSGVHVGISICYDAEFPEMPRMARLAGAELLVVPATNMSPYERDQDLIFPTRALENEFPVAVCNRVGTERGWTYFGRSLTADARGEVVAQADGGTQLLVADIELAERPTDPELSYIARRRPEVYRPLSQPAERGENASGFKERARKGPSRYGRTVADAG